MQIIMMMRRRRFLERTMKMYISHWRNNLQKYDGVVIYFFLIGYNYTIVRHVARHLKTAAVAASGLGKLTNMLL